MSWGTDSQKGLTATQSGDFTTALWMWTPLAEQGDASAQYNLGVLYERGQGVPQDHKAAVKWYRLAAEQGVHDAQYNLGVMYRKGLGVPQDDKMAAGLWLLAAEQGLTRAQNNLGVMYVLGRGVRQDYLYAHMWANIAASNGYINGRKLIDLVEEKITPSEISEARKLAHECVLKKYKKC